MILHANPAPATGRDLDDAWRRRGYQVVGRKTYRRGAYLARLYGGWLSIETQTAEHSAAGGEAWKPAGPNIDVFELPADVVLSATNAAGEPALDEAIGRLTEWYEARRRDELPAGWNPPEAASVRKGTAAELWSLEVGPHLRTIEFDAGPRRAAFRTTLAAAAEGLSPARCEALARKVAFADRHWRWVRLSTAADRPTVTAEIDLAGCPIAWFETLTKPALWALRRTAEHLLPTVAMMTDSRVCCESWEER
jgi:hypothetical protein